jgi:two-component system sensor kinase
VSDAPITTRATAVIADRFEVGPRQSAGTTIEVYGGLDRRDHTAVRIRAIALSRCPAGVRMRLEHEARVLQEISALSPRRIIWSGTEGPIFYVVQAQGRGHTLADVLQAGALSVPATVAVASNVLRSLQLAHERHVLHGDVRPEHIIVEGDEQVESAHLFDYLLVRDDDLDETRSQQNIAAVRYIAPEAAGLITVAVDHRADLYSLGIVLFECLTGHPPFDGASVGELLRQHLNVEVSHLGSLGVSVPRALDGIVHRLLAKDPANRYQSATSALADIEELSLLMEQGDADPSVILGRHDRRHALAEPSFVGRAAELAMVTELMQRDDTQQGRLVFVAAESGAGKTRLFDELALQASLGGFWVMRGQGVDQAAQRPFQVLDGVIDEVVAAEKDGYFTGGLRAVLGDWADATAAAIPSLASLLGPLNPASLGPEAYGEHRNLDALCALLTALGQGPRPVLLLLDDCQWADAMTVALLGKWQELRGPMAAPVLTVAAYRSEEVSEGHPLRGMVPWSTVTLSPFARDDVEALCRSMAGAVPEEVVSTVTRLAEGSPFMASAVLRGMVETGALRDTVRGWEIDPGPMADVQTSRRTAAFLSKRFDLMSPMARHLLTVGAVLGKEFDLGLAAELSGEDASYVTTALVDARQRRILWVDESEGRCSFTHDKLRETLLDRLDPAERVRLHRLAAVHIERTDRDRIFDLAYHFDAAGESTRALPHALKAAELARSRHALDVAIAHYRIAERAVEQMEPAADPFLQGQIAEGLGDVLTLRGEYREAASCLDRALTYTDDPIRRAIIHGKLGDNAFKQGDQANASRYLEGAMRDLGRWVPRGRTTRFLAAMGQAVIQVLHTLFPKLFVARRQPDGAEREFAAIRIFSRMAYVYWFSAGKMPCAWAHLSGMNLAERYPPSAELAQAYSEHAPVMTMLPWYSRGLQYARRSLEIRQAAGDVWGQGQSLSFYGAGLYASSRFRECIDACSEAVHMLERTGDRWEQNTATWHQVFSYYRLGQLDVALDIARGLHARATEIGDTTSAGIALSGWARASLGRVPESFIALELARDLGDAHTATEVRLADAIRLLHTGHYERAVERLEAANEIIADAGLRQEYVAPVKPWLATALRTQIESTDAHEPHTRQRLLRRLAKASRQADRLSRSYRNNRPHALRERGYVAGLLGHPEKAQRYFARSLAVSEAQGAAYETALTAVASARLDQARGKPLAAIALEVAESALHGYEPHPGETVAVTLSLADRFELLLEVGRLIGRAPSPAAVYQEVHQAAIRLLRGEHCGVLRCQEGGAVLLADSDAIEHGVSASLLNRAVAQGSPVISGPKDLESDDVLLLSEERSVLCAPVICEGQVVACFYVTHRQVNDLFGGVEIQLAEFIATLAGAALEHVAGSEARFRSLAQNSSDVITIVDSGGAIVYQSSSVEQIFGVKPDAMLGQPLSSWLHPEDGHELLEYVTLGSDASPSSELVQARMRHNDGTWRVGESSVRILFDDPGVEGMVLNTRDASERVALEAELRERASHDHLTGLANRALFVERVSDAFARRPTAGRTFAVVFLDLDDFKSINDAMGHVAGDLLLQLTAERLERCVRPGDTVARWGGDEFAVLLEDADAESSKEVVHRIITELEQPYRVLNQEVICRASLGVAVAEDDELADDLLIGADLAMYVAKLSGKSRYEFFVPAMREAAVERSALLTDLQWSMLRDELTIHYQPIVNLPGGDLLGFEALLRWDHPTRGQLLPDHWIMLAEESGLILSLGKWVLRNACQQVALWQRVIDRDLMVAVNVSARQLQSPTLVGEIAAALAESRLRPSSLVLEITESATVQDTEGAIARLQELKELGVGLSIDDFGTGYSSLSYLRRFPVDHLKVDRSFVAELMTNPEDLAIVSSVINLGHSLGLQVIAEGVETEDQLTKLCEMECDQAQGFKWRHPADAEEVGRWLVSMDTDSSPV